MTDALTSTAADDQLLLQALASLTLNFDQKMEEVRTLLGRGADPDARTDAGLPALMLAVGNINANMSDKLVRMLVAHGANPNILDQDSQRNAFFYARESHAVHALIEAGTDILTKDGSGQTAAEHYDALCRLPYYGTPEISTRERNAIEYVAMAVEAHDWIALEQVKGSLHYAHWLDALEKAESEGSLYADIHPRMGLASCWREATRHVLEACLANGTLSREALFEPRSGRHLAYKLAHSPKTVTFVQRLCEQMGNPLQPEEVVQSGILGELMKFNHVHFLFHYEYWNTRSWPEMQQFLEGLPSQAKSELLDNPKLSYAELFVPHLRRWLQSDEVKSMPFAQWQQQVSAVPEQILRHVGGWHQLAMVRRRQDMHAIGGQGRA